MPLDSLPMQFEQEANVPELTGYGAKLVKITLSLTDLIKQETSLLEQRLPREAQKLHGQKNRLMAEYRETLNHLQVNEKLLGPKESSVRQYIQKVTDAFREVLRDHARIVLRLKSVAEGIIKSVGEEVVKKNRPVVGYGKNAAFKTPAQMQPTSLQLNQVI